MTTREKIPAAGWNFDNSFARLPAEFFSLVDPTPVRAPQLVLLNYALAENLGLLPEALTAAEGVAALAGNSLPAGALPLAQAYAGHQFGHFTILGDGRAHLLGEQLTPTGQRFDLQLKGSGRTPYSRGGDGRAALGPMLREYLISEAMAALGIPTTRSLAVLLTGETIQRETPLPGAILVRVAASHLRIGTFQYVARRQGTAPLRILTDYARQRHDPAAAAAENPPLSFLQGVIKRQASLVARWQLVGFVHGVLNTDNLTISGETIDYGPCAFIDTYDPATVFSSIDRQGRYAYGRQPEIVAWNLARLAESLLPLLSPVQQTAVEMAEQALSEFFPLYQAFYQQGMRNKLGLFNVEEEDQTLIADFLALLQKHQADYSNTCRLLSAAPVNLPPFAAADFQDWLGRWEARLTRQREDRGAAQGLMKANNPAVIPRNHRVEEVLAAAVEEKDYQPLERLLQVLAQPYSYTPGETDYTAPPPLTAGPYRTFCGT